MNHKDRYGASHSPTWFRIDMLIALYDGAIKQTRLAIEVSLDQGKTHSVVHRTRATAIITAIRSGVDPSHGEVPVRVEQLCEFVQHCLVEGHVEQMQAALHVLQQLHDAFLGIRDEARQLEVQGVIPPAPHESTLDSCF